MVGRGVERRGQAAGDRAGAVCQHLAKHLKFRADPVAQRPREVHPVRLRQDRFVVIGILIPIDREVIDVVRRQRLAETHVPVGKRDDVEHPRRAHRRGGAARGRDDAAIAGGTRANEGAGCVERAAHEAAIVARVGAEAVVEIVVANHRPGRVREGQAVPGRGDIAREPDVLVAGELALIQPEKIPVIIIERQQQIAPAAVEIASVGDLDVPVVAAAVLRHAAAGANRQAVVVRAGDGIHDARGRVGAVDRRSAVAQDLDSRHGRGGKLVHVDCHRGHTALGLADRMRRQPAAVEQDERIARPDTAEIDRGVVAAGVGAERITLVERDRTSDRERFEQFGRRGHGAQVEVLHANDSHGQRLLLFEPPDVGTGDGEGLHQLRLGARGRTGRRRRSGRRLRGQSGGEGEGRQSNNTIWFHGAVACRVNGGQIMVGRG